MQTTERFSHNLYKLTLAGALALFAACTADLDTFGQSDYRAINDISFEEQDNGPAINENEHRITVRLRNSNDSSCTWDSVSIDGLDISSLSSLHLVEDSIATFPKDSSVLDSLSRKLSYESKKIQSGSRIALPKNDTLYIVVVSENGIPSLWQMVFSTPGASSCQVPSSNSNKEESSSSSAKDSSANDSSAKSSSSTGSDDPEGSSSSGSDTPGSSGTPASSESSSNALDAPRIVSLKIATVDAFVDNENRYIHVDSLPFLADLSSLELTELELSEGAISESHKAGEKYDFGTGQKIVVKNADGDSVTYSVKAGYQVPGSDFDSWSGNDVLPDSLWGNANTIVTTTEKYTSGSMIGAKISTGNALVKIASGSLYTADFNPNGVSTLSMASSSTWPDGNELLDFGKPFRARPEYAEFKFSYDGRGDSCDIYILLENRTGNKNTDRTASDVNKLVASAWYRSTTDDNTDRENPDVVSISAKDENGMRTLRLRFKYGNPLENSPIENSSTFATALQSSNKAAVNNALIQGDGSEPVTHIRVVFASSADGNHYQGTKNATLIVDNMKLIY